MAERNMCNVVMRDIAVPPGVEEHITRKWIAPGPGIPRVWPPVFVLAVRWMRPPVGIYREPGCRWHEWAVKHPRQNVRWKDARQCPGETGYRLPISFLLLVLPFGHVAAPPSRWASCHRTCKAFLTSVSGLTSSDLYLPALMVRGTGEPDRRSTRGVEQEPGSGGK